MTEPNDGSDKLRVVHSGGALDVRRWPHNAEAEARETLEEVLRDCDRFMLVGVCRTDDGGTRIVSYHARRGVRVAALELIGAVYSRLHDFLNEL